MADIILGIESSCDDTSAAVIKDGYLLSNVLASQEVHKAYGGVIPELASRAHQVNIVPVVSEAVSRAGIKAEDITAKGIVCLKLSAEGYTSKELSEKYSAKPATVRMWMTKARRYLQTQPEIAQKYYRGAAL